MLVSNQTCPYPEELYPLYKKLCASNHEDNLEEEKKALYGNQEKYQELTHLATNKLHQALKQLKENHSMLGSSSFYKTVMELGAIRSQIAFELNSIHKEKFGIHRCNEEGGEHCTITHLLPQRYREANQKIRLLLMDRLQELKREGKDKAHWETATSRYTVEIIDQSKFQGMIVKFSKRPETPREAIELNYEIDLGNTISGIIDIIQHLQLPNLTLSKFPAISPIKFVVGSIQTKVGKEWKLLTRHVSWINQAKSGPINEVALEYFKRFAWVTLLHTPRSDIDDRLTELSGIWKQIILWNERDKEELASNIDLLEYKLHHIMPFCRGSVTTVEIHKGAIGLLHNVELTRTSDMDALTQPYLEEYRKEKRSTIS